MILIIFIYFESFVFDWRFYYLHIRNSNVKKQLWVGRLSNNPGNTRFEIPFHVSVGKTSVEAVYCWSHIDFVSFFSRFVGSPLFVLWEYFFSLLNIHSQKFCPSSRVVVRDFVLSVLLRIFAFYLRVFKIITYTCHVFQL